MTKSASAVIMEAVRGRMELIGMNQRELAAHSGIPQSTVSRWLSGQRVPDVNELTALADALRIAPEKLLKGRSR